VLLMLLFSECFPVTRRRTPFFLVDPTLCQHIRREPFTLVDHFGILWVSESPGNLASSWACGI